MFCLIMLSLKRKIIPFTILGLLVSCSLAGISHPFVYAQSGPSYNLTSSYIVEYGDTLAAIAARHGVSIQKIATTNSIRNINTIRVGQVLIIPSPVAGGYSSNAYAPAPDALAPDVLAPDVLAPDAPAVVQSPYRPNNPSAPAPQTLEMPVYSAPISSCQSSPQGGERIHNVRPGDTLYGMARTYGISVTALRQRNGLTTDRIRVGECLLVPAGTTITPVPDRRRSSEQPPMTITPTTSFQPTVPTATVYKQG